MTKVTSWLKRLAEGQKGQSAMLVLLSASVVGILAITLVNAFSPSIQIMTLDRARAMVAAAPGDFTTNGDLLPGADDTYRIGVVGNEWSELHIEEGTVVGVLTVGGIGDGVLTNYDLLVGDTTTPSYGVIRFGDAAIGRVSFNVGAVDLDGTVIFRNLGGPVTGLIEFLWEEGSGATRFAIPSSGVGNATYSPRSILIAGPAPADTDMVTVGYWQTTNSIFHNLAADTAGDGADLGVQNDLEIEGDLFVDSIIESTPGAGVTLGASLYILERAAAGADVAGRGQIWVRDDAPNTLYFTDDTGTDHAILTGATGIKHEFHMPFEDPTGVVGNWDVVEINAAQDTHFTFQVPENFEALVNARVVMIPDTTETIQWDINVSISAGGEAYNNDDRSALNQTLAVTAGQITEVDISGQLSGLAGGDYVAIDFQSDTANLRIIGFEFDYT